MGEEDYYLELCERPVRFEEGKPGQLRLLRQANKQVQASRALLPLARRALPAAPDAAGVPRRGQGPGMRSLGPPRQSRPVRHPSDRALPRPETFSPKVTAGRTRRPSAAAVRWWHAGVSPTPSRHQFPLQSKFRR